MDAYETDLEDNRIKAASDIVKKVKYTHHKDRYLFEYKDELVKH